MHNGIAHEDAAIELARCTRLDEVEARREVQERHGQPASSPIDPHLRFWKTWDWKAMTSHVHDTLTGEIAEFDLRSAFECHACCQWVERQRNKREAA